MSNEALQEHLEWFRKELVEAGAPEDLSDDKVRASAGFAHSEKSFVAGHTSGGHNKVDKCENCMVSSKEGCEECRGEANEYWTCLECGNTGNGVEYDTCFRCCAKRPEAPVEEAG